MSSEEGKDQSYQTVNAAINITAAAGATVTIDNNIVTFHRSNGNQITGVTYNEDKLIDKFKRFVNNAEASDVSGPVVIGGGTLEAATQGTLAVINETKLTSFVHNSMHVIEKLFHHGNIISATQATVNALGIVIYFLRLLMELSILYNEKKAGNFSKNEENNDKIATEYIHKSVWSNVGAMVTLGIGSVIIGLFITNIWPAVLASIGFMILAWVVHFGIRKYWNHYRLGGRYYKALLIFRMRKQHATITQKDISDKYEKLVQDIAEDIVNEKEAQKQLDNLNAAKQELESYLQIRDQENGLVRDKVEYYIQHKDNTNCVIL